MTFLDDCLCGRSQLLTQSDTRKFVMGWAGLANAIPHDLPQPDFVIGDKVADHWTDEFGKDCIEYGEVFGICWHPRKQVWAYLINWTSGQGPDSLYPCFDQRLVIGGELRLVSHD